ncbi:MAG: alpha/beta fold hydrolase [Oscillochloris sp.]|nr:alpha/beta fold hydrolase [Oscillochloris sp.]
MNEQIHGPHQGMSAVSTGTPLGAGQTVVVMIHGRGATAESILSLAPELHADNVTFIAPQAAGNTWYPFGFMEPIQRNEPFLSSALAQIEQLLDQIASAGIPPERTVLLGFSQGACLAGEFVARNARRYGGLIMFSGGLIGPDGTPRDYPGDLADTAVFLGCSDRDFHIPQQRVEHSAEVLERLGGSVTMKIYPGMGHTVNEDELNHARAIVAALR